MITGSRSPSDPSAAAHDRVPDPPVDPATPAAAAARRYRILAFGVLLVVGLAFTSGSLTYDWTTIDGTIGPAVLPRITAVMLTLLSVALLVRELRTPVQQAGITSDVPEAIVAASGTPDPTPLTVGSARGAHSAAPPRRRLPVVVATMWVATLLVPVLGLLPSLVAAMFALLAVVERIGVLRALGISALTYAVAHLLFVTLLGVPMPLGLFDPLTWGAP